MSVSRQTTYFLFMIGFPGFLGIAGVFSSSFSPLSSPPLSPFALKAETQRFTAISVVHRSSGFTCKATCNLQMNYSGSMTHHPGVKKKLTKYLMCSRSKQVGSCEVEVTDGRHGDGVVGVIELYRLRGARYDIIQIIFCLLCLMGEQKQ